MPKTTKILKFRKVTPGEVTKVIAKFKNSRAVVIPSRFLKDASSRIAFPLASIFSESLEIDVFPDNLKLARISASSNVLYPGHFFKKVPLDAKYISTLIRWLNLLKTILWKKYTVFILCFHMGYNCIFPHTDFITWCEQASSAAQACKE